MRQARISNLPRPAHAPCHGDCGRGARRTGYLECAGDLIRAHSEPQRSHTSSRRRARADSGARSGIRGSPAPSTTGCSWAGPPYKGQDRPEGLRRAAEPSRPAARGPSGCCRTAGWVVCCGSRVRTARPRGCQRAVIRHALRELMARTAATRRVPVREVMWKGAPLHPGTVHVQDRVRRSVRGRDGLKRPPMSWGSTTTACRPPRHHAKQAQLSSPASIITPRTSPTA